MRLTVKKKKPRLKEVSGKRFQVQFQPWQSFLENLRTTIDEQDESLLKKFVANYRSKIRGELPRAANSRSKFRRVETIGVAKMRQNFAKIHRISLKSHEIRQNSFALLLHNAVNGKY